MHPVIIASAIGNIIAVAVDDQTNLIITDLILVVENSDRLCDDRAGRHTFGIVVVYVILNIFSYYTIKHSSTP
jgi:hypothetical protein